MSLREFKRSLKTCSSNSSSSQSQSQSCSILADFDVNKNPRKPHKTSLAKQFQRLEDPIFNSRIERRDEFEKPVSTSSAVSGSGNEDVEEEEKKSVGIQIPKKEFALFETGPFEPLVLSPEGEFPVVQIPAAFNCRLLAHQREGVKFLYMLYRNNHGGVLGDDIIHGNVLSKIDWEVVIVDEATDLKMKNQREKPDGCDSCPFCVCFLALLSCSR